MAIDYGSKRVGIAVTDNLQIISTGLKTVETKDIFKFLEEYFKKEEVETIVVGEPKHLDNTPAQAEAIILPFVKKLSDKFKDKKVVRYDERFTSKMAFQTMIDSGLKKMQRRNKALIDEISAVIILQSYMESRKR
jgi:putative Holliday junction resolvase